MTGTIARRLAIFIFERSPEMITKWKRKITRVIPLQIANVWRLRKELMNGEPELHLLPVLCRPDRIIVDVGANLGIYTHAARRYARHVIAIEPQPLLAASLRSAYGGTSVEVVQCGLSDRPGTFSLYVPIIDSLPVDTRASLLSGLNGNTEVSVQIPVRTLDSFSLNDVNLIKIDVEGLELEVLRGARETLARCRPAIVVEAEERMRPGTVASVAELMESLNYAGFFIWRLALQSITEFEVGYHQAPGSAKSVGDRQSADYVSNFIYLPREAKELQEQVRSTIASMVHA
jgi:FkbM family methyltransferase